MKFGTYIAPVSRDPSQDAEMIDRTLKEIELAETIGMEAAWLTEHHFWGECAYADPLVFGAAIAARTNRIKIGFAVVQMALHNPVRLATQTALLDNLSHGRLIVGTGRGTAFNHYEYAGFGTTIEEGVEKLDEAEDLLVQTWVGENIQFEGKYWKASIPMLRPPPFQKPHPPLARACLSKESVKKMAKIGRPILIGATSNDIVGQRLQLYRETMAGCGFDEAAIDKAYNQIWIAKNLCVADSYGEAKYIAESGYVSDMEHVLDGRRRYNPPTDPIEIGTARRAHSSSQALPIQEESFESLSLLGTPRQVADQIAELRDLGVRNLMLENSFGQMSFDQVSQTLTRFGEEVAPVFIQS